VILQCAIPAGFLAPLDTKVFLANVRVGGDTMNRFAIILIGVAGIAFAIFAYFKIAHPTVTIDYKQTFEALTPYGHKTGAGAGYVVVTGAEGRAVTLGKGEAGDHLLVHASLLGLPDADKGGIAMFNLLGGVFAFDKPRLEAFLPKPVDGNLNLFTDAQGKDYRVFYFVENPSPSIFQANASNASVHYYLNTYFADGPVIEYRQYADVRHLEIRILGGGSENTIEDPGQSTRAVLETIVINDFHDGDFGIHLGPVYLPYGSYPKAYMLLHKEDAETRFDSAVASAIDSAVHAISDTAHTYSLTADGA